MRAVIGVDVGGTTSVAGLVAPDGAVLAEASAPTHHRGPGTAVETLVELIESVRGRAREEKLEPLGIGVGVAAVVRPPGGRRKADTDPPELQPLFAGARPDLERTCLESTQQRV